jgi:hypothetical protein
MKRTLPICNPHDISYTVAADGQSILFRPCGVRSFNANDVKEKYCARCHRFMDLLAVARDLTREAGFE